MPPKVWLAPRPTTKLPEEPPSRLNQPTVQSKPLQEQPPSRLPVYPTLPAVRIPFKDLPTNLWEFPIHDLQWCRTYWVPTVEALLCQEPTNEAVTLLVNHYYASRGAALCKYHWQRDQGMYYNNINDVVPVVATIMGRWDRNKVRQDVVELMADIKDHRWRELCASVGLDPYPPPDVD